VRNWSQAFAFTFNLYRYMVAAEATFAADAVAEQIGDVDNDDKGCGKIPRMRWSVDPDDWETGKGPGDDDMLGEENFGRKKKREDHPGGDDESDEEHDSFLDMNERIGGGVKLAGRVLKSMGKTQTFDSAWCATTLSRAAEQDGDPVVKEMAVTARDAVLESKACARFAADRFRYGGIVGGHVAVWAALNPDRALPPMVDEIIASKVELYKLNPS
jgi:hypothetical protein